HFAGRERYAALQCAVVAILDVVRVAVARIPRDHAARRRDATGRRDKRITHRFRDALRAVEVAAAIITARADVDVLSGRQVQTCQGPVAAGRCAVAQGSVVHIVGGILKGNARELRAGAAAGPGNGGLRHSQVLQCGDVVAQTSEFAARLTADTGEKAAR